MGTEQGKEVGGTYEKTYVMGDVGAGARVQQGEHLSWVERVFLGDSPDLQALRTEFGKLLERLAEDSGMDEDTRDVSIEKAKKVAEALAEAPQSPGELRRALVDAKAWFKTAPGWVWGSLNRIMASDAAQKVIGTITDASVRAAIGSLTALS
jgi:hypothetical protein